MCRHCRGFSIERHPSAIAGPIAIGLEPKRPGAVGRIQVGRPVPLKGDREFRLGWEDDRRAVPRQIKAARIDRLDG